MAWGRGAAAGIDDLCARLSSNDATLTSLTLLSGRRFGPPEVSQLAAALRMNTTLTELCAARPLAPSSAAELAAALAVNATLRRLCVGDAAFGDDGCAALAPGLGRLQSLELERKGITPVGAAALAAALANGALRELSVARNAALGDDGAAVLLAATAGRGLVALDAGGCGLTPGAGAALGPLLAQAATLVTLTLPSNALGPEGCAALAAGLHAAQALRALDLSGCVAGDAGAAALAAALPTSGLSRLHLARCDIGAEGAAALAAAVRECDSLKHLFLEGNGRVGDEGAKALAEAFTAHTAAAEGPRLAVLDVGECGITAVGAAALLAADGAASLSLFGNLAAAGAGGALLAAALAGGGQRMTHLNISGTGLVAEGAAALTAALLAGASPALRTIELGANPLAQAEEWPALLQALRDGRPDLDVAWRAADPGEQGAQRP